MASRCPPPPTINSLTSANRGLELCKQRKATVVKRFKDGKPEFLLVAKSGTSEIKVGAKYEFMFREFMAANGNGDGFWPGLDQTAAT